MSGAQMRKQFAPTLLLVLIILAAFLFALSPGVAPALSPGVTSALSPAGKPIAQAAQARTLTVDDVGLEVGVSNPQLSPDGGAVVVIVSRPDYDGPWFWWTLPAAPNGS